MNNNNIPSPDFGIEQQVIGEILNNEDAAFYAFEVLDADDFQLPMHRSLYQMIVDKFNKGENYDAMSLAGNLLSMDSRFTAEYLYKLLQLIISTEGYKEHIKIVKRNGMQKKMKLLSQNMGDYADEGERSIQEMQTYISNSLDIFTDGEAKTSVTCGQGFDLFLENVDVKREYIETGIAPIDTVLKISKGDYIVIGARPSVGKTAFSLQIAWDMAKNNKVVFYSFETNIQKIMDRIISNRCSIDYNRIITNNITDVEKADIAVEKKRAKELNFEIVEASGMTVAEIQASAVRKKADIIFIDYLGLIAVNSDKVISSYEMTTQISKDLHTMAQKRKIAVVALSQLNREGDNFSPSLVSLRDSGQIEQDADAVILMSKAKSDDLPEDYNARKIAIAKNKSGGLGAIYMNFIGEKQMFIPIKEEHEWAEDGNDRSRS